MIPDTSIDLEFEMHMRAPAFGLSTTPITDIKSELRLQIERDLLGLVYRSTR